MARRRYLSTTISRDKQFNQLRREYGDFPVMLYMLMIPHAEDDATLIADPEELMLMVIPGMRDVDPDEVEHALWAMAQVGLIEWRPGAKQLGFPPDSFYRYQTYIPVAKRRSTPLFADETDDQRPDAEISEDRRTSPRSAENQRESPQNTVSLKPSPSPSPSPSPKEEPESGDVEVVERARTRRHQSTPGESDSEPGWRRVSVSDTERYIVSCLNSVPGGEDLTASQIIPVVRECLDNRGSPIPDNVLRSQMHRFREHWAKRRKQASGPWVDWEIRLSSWIEKIHVPEPNGRYDDVDDDEEWEPPDEQDYIHRGDGAAREGMARTENR